MVAPSFRLGCSLSVHIRTRRHARRTLKRRDCYFRSYSAPSNGGPARQASSSRLVAMPSAGCVTGRCSIRSRRWKANLRSHHARRLIPLGSGKRPKNWGCYNPTRRNHLSNFLLEVVSVIRAVPNPVRMASPGRRRSAIPAAGALPTVRLA
jgi:hypothetical protein